MALWVANELLAPPLAPLGACGIIQPPTSPWVRSRNRDVTEQNLGHECDESPLSEMEPQQIQRRTVRLPNMMPSSQEGLQPSQWSTYTAVIPREEED